MTRFRLILSSLWHHRSLNLLVALSVAIASATLTGAFIVGDSVRGSLRQIVLERLGPMDLILLGDRFFAPEMVQQLQDPAVIAQPAILLPHITVEAQNQGMRTNGVFVTAWPDGSPAGLATIADDEIVINRTLANELGANVGDRLVIRLPEFNEVPADSPLGRKDDRVRSRGGLRVREILNAKGLGKLSLALNQQDVPNAFVALSVLQRTMGVGKRVNAVVFTKVEPDPNPNLADDTELALRLTRQLQPNLADFGISASVERGVYQEPEAESEGLAWSYLQFTTDRMILDDVAANAITEALRTQSSVGHVLTYLANSIHVPGAEGEIPYSTVSAIDQQLVATLWPDGGALEEDGILLNSWAAEDLGVDVGDQVELDYFDPETTHGQAIEKSQRFTVQGIVPIIRPDRPFSRRSAARFSQPPTTANDPGLTPLVEGVTDQESIDDWNPPFPFDQRRVQPEDDDYWEYYRTTPKAFITAAMGHRLWGSRFGATTSIRVAWDATSTTEIEAAVLDRLRESKQQLGFVVRPIRASSLEAAAGTTPFEGLFIGFNFFLIAAALMLIAILVQLTIQTRARDLGILTASGWPLSQLRRQIGGEAVLVVFGGAWMGLPLGIGFAAAMLYALRTWWVRAIAAPFVQLHVRPETLLMGVTFAGLLSVAVAYWVLRRLFHSAPTSLLRGRVEVQGAAVDHAIVGDAARRPKGTTPRSTLVGWLFVVVAGIVAMLGSRLEGIAQAGAFFGSGSMVLAGLLILMRSRLQAPCGAATGAIDSFMQLKRSAAARNPGRSVLTIGLVATACFLIIAMAAFRLQPTSVGTGGFQIVARSDRPVFEDLGNPDVRGDLLGGAFRDRTILGLRLKPGDDASCRNLFQIGRPTLIGVTPQFVDFMRESEAEFGWAAVADKNQHPWQPLLDSAGAEKPIPVILDQNTAMYSLHLRGKIGEEFQLPFDPPLRFRIVGLLSNSVLQGHLIVSESELLRRFPEVAGYQFFLAGVDSMNDAAGLSAALENRFGDEGLDARDAQVTLDNLLAVQNTYLTTFQSLGSLGLLLGTVGLAFVQLRNVAERRGELALMQTMGFSPKRLGSLVMGETIWLIVAGLGIGTLAAAVTVVPHVLAGAARPPWLALAGMLLTILVCGILASQLAVRWARGTPVLQTLRQEI